VVAPTTVLIEPEVAVDEDTVSALCDIVVKADAEVFADPDTTAGVVVEPVEVSVAVEIIESLSRNIAITIMLLV